MGFPSPALDFAEKRVRLDSCRNGAGYFQGAEVQKVPRDSPGGNRPSGEAILDAG